MLSHWGKLQTVITVSGAVARNLAELKQQTGNIGYEELIGLLLDSYIPARIPLETTFVCTLPSKKAIQTRLQETLTNAESAKEVSLTGWIDGSIIPALQDLLRKGVHVRLLTRHSTEKGVTNAIQQLRKSRAKIRRNDMVHARMLIVGDQEVLISSADPKASSLVDNREAGVYSTNPVIIRAARGFFEEVWNEPETKTI